MAIAGEMLERTAFVGGSNWTMGLLLENGPFVDLDAKLGRQGEEGKVSCWNLFLLFLLFLLSLQYLLYLEDLWLEADAHRVMRMQLMHLDGGKEETHCASAPSEAACDDGE